MVEDANFKGHYDEKTVENMAHAKFQVSGTGNVDTTPLKDSVRSSVCLSACPFNFPRGQQSNNAFMLLLIISLLQVSTECPGIDHEFRVNQDLQNKLTFRSQGRTALSYITKPRLKRAKW